MHEVNLLDLDSGMRIYGKYEGKRCYIFVTRSLHGHTLMIYGTKSRGNEPEPSTRMYVKEFEHPEELEKFLHTVVTRPVKAFVY